MIMIDIVIPTIHACELFLHEYLPRYVKYPSLKKIIVIDNAPKSNKSKLLSQFKTDKLEILKQNTNSYVNHSWNIGASHAESELLVLLNDDVFLSEKSVDFLLAYPWNSDTLICSSLNTNESTSGLVDIRHDKSMPICWSDIGSIGHMLAMKRSAYHSIPNNLKIFFGDDFLLGKFKTIIRMDGFLKGNRSVSTKSQWLNERFRIDLQTDWINGFASLFHHDLRENLHCVAGTGAITDKNTLILLKDQKGSYYCSIAIRLQQDNQDSEKYYNSLYSFAEEKGIEKNSGSLKNQIFHGVQIKNTLDLEDPDAIEYLLNIAYMWITQGKDIRVKFDPKIFSPIRQY